MRNMLGRIGLALLLAALAAPLAGADTLPTVATTTGTFTAVPSPSLAGVDAFFGIRYAAAPVANLRWSPPQAPIAPTGTVVAGAPGDACPQPSNTAPLAQSEDCLFLNVFVPASATPQSKLPVFYWIHGGALVTGSGADYDPSVMVAQSNIIVVTINYRLGVLGWLAEPGLAAASADAFENPGDSGNYGLMDQQFGMQWVQANIAGFGGDPTKVTIGGESAGGLSVSSQLTSTKLAAGLFRGAIIESGAYMHHDLPSQSAYQALFGGAFEKLLDCAPPSDAACLRGQSVANLLTAQGRAFGSDGITPDFGTLILPSGLHTAFSAGAFIQVPVLQGNNINEGRLFEPGEFPFAGTLAQVAAAGGPANFALTNSNSFCAAPGGAPAACTYLQEIHLYLNLLGAPPSFDTALVDDILAATYPLTAFPDPFLPNNAPSSDEALAQIFTDLVFACNTFDSNSDLAKFVPVFAYEFNDPNAPPLATIIKPPNDEFGFPTASEHSAELQFLFNFGTPLTDDEQLLANDMKLYWGNFVKTGNPELGNPAALVQPWTHFNFSQAIQSLAPPPEFPRPFFTFPTRHSCGLWELFLNNEPPL
jgi:para-nitrobenzyl esterase